MSKIRCLIHDIMNSATALSGRLTQLRNLDRHLDESNSAQATIRHAVQVADAAKSAQLNLVKQLQSLKSLAGCKPLTTVASNLADVATDLRHQATEILQPLFGMTVSVVLDADKDCKVRASDVYFNMLWENLIGNAAAAGASHVFVGIFEQDDKISIRISDNGKGMTRSQLDQLGLGFTTKTEPGHGEGFAAVRRLTAEVGGYVNQPTSEVGKGTDIVVVLRRAKEETYGDLDAAEAAAIVL